MNTRHLQPGTRITFNGSDNITGTVVGIGTIRQGETPEDRTDDIAVLVWLDEPFRGYIDGAVCKDKLYITTVVVHHSNIDTYYDDEQEYWLLPAAR